MTTRLESVTSGQRLYDFLLMLYPAGFRERFGAEMRQIYRDSCRCDTGHGGLLRPVAFWFKTLRDLVLSLLRLWIRELAQIRETSYLARADSLAVPLVIAMTLIAAGHTAAILARNVAPPVAGSAHHMSQNVELCIAAGVTACLLGLMGSISAFIVARINRAKRPWLNLSTGRKWNGQ